MSQPRLCNAPSALSSSEPEQNIEIAAIVGLAMRLVQRLDVRQEPTSASPADASVAAAGPCSSNRLKMKISPAANEFFERGMRTGNMPASIATTTPIITCRHCDAERRVVTALAANAIVTAPSTTTVHQ
ncbi:MAG: hypothetical protein E6H65_05590 [Betaproteobacteria bacterium]|nr:MAG: hypothetical protein E6H65_05590 [Betaproteobacteria bacterium]